MWKQEVLQVLLPVWNDTDIRGLTAASGRTINSTSSGVTDFSDYYGATSETSLGDSAGSNINGQVQLSNITVSNYISSGGTLRTFNYVGLV